MGKGLAIVDFHKEMFCDVYTLKTTGGLHELCLPPPGSSHLLYSLFSALWLRHSQKMCSENTRLLNKKNRTWGKSVHWLEITLSLVGWYRYVLALQRNETIKIYFKKRSETVLQRPANSQVPRARSLMRCVILYLCIVEGSRSHRTIANGLGAQGLWAISVSSYFDFSIWSCQKLIICAGNSTTCALCFDCVCHVWLANLIAFVSGAFWTDQCRRRKPGKINCNTKGLV